LAADVPVRARRAPEEAAGVPVGDLAERLAAYRDADTAGPWWPGQKLVIVCEREPGPVLRWSDGTSLIIGAGRSGG
jgi:hypothetical protein